MRSLKQLAMGISFGLAVAALPASAVADSGKMLFFEETFGGNGQRCGTCHRQEEGQFLAFSPSFAQQLYSTHPEDPLFTPINSADRVGGDFTGMFTNGTVPIPIDLPLNVVAVPVTAGAQVYTNPETGRQYILVPRKTPRVTDIANKGVLMLDGRMGHDFGAQAAGAADTHFGPHLPLTQKQKEKLEAFQKKQFSDEDMRRLANEGVAPELPEAVGYLESIGKRMLEPGPLGKCSMCHGGPGLNKTTEDNIVNTILGMEPGMDFAVNFSGGTAFNFPFTVRNTNPVYMFTITSVDDNGLPTPDEGGQSYRILFSADPGAVLNQDENGYAHPCRIDIGNCIINGPSPANGFLPLLREEHAIPSLWRIGDLVQAGGTFFHHGQAHTLQQVMENYKELFNVTADGLEALFPGSDFDYLRITEEEELGTVLYLTNRMRSKHSN